MPFSPEEKVVESHVMPWWFWFLVLLSLFLIITFVYYLPLRFLYNSGALSEDMHGEVKEAGRGHGEDHDIATVFESEPENIDAGKPALLSFTFPGTELDEFSIEHERLVHLVIIREDLETFAHVHLEPVAESPARFEVWFTFPLSGTYLLSTNYLHDDSEGTWREIIHVAGNDAAVRDADVSRRKQIDPYDIKLSVDPGTPRAGEEAHFLWTIAKDGEAVLDLMPYLAAPSHIAVVRDDLSYFLHEHGDIPDNAAAAVSFVPTAYAHGDEAPAVGVSHGEHAELPAAFGPAVEGHLTFPQAGRYKVFAEFQHEQRVLVAGFLVDVEEGR